MRRTSISACAIARGGFSVSASASVTAETLNDRRVPLLKQLSCQRLPEAKCCGGGHRPCLGNVASAHAIAEQRRTRPTRWKRGWHNASAGQNGLALRRPCCQDQCNRDKSTSHRENCSRSRSACNVSTPVQAAISGAQIGAPCLGAPRRETEPHAKSAWTARPPLPRKLLPALSFIFPEFGPHHITTRHTIVRLAHRCKLYERFSERFSTLCSLWTTRRGRS